MLKNLGKSVAVVAFAALTSFPAAGQVDLRFGIPLPEVEIRVGRSAPPSARHEHKPPRPGRGFLWLKGSWGWHENDWTWMPGRWERPGQRGVKWVKARYRRDGNAWRYEPAHWSNQRMIEGEDYRRWRSERDGDRNHGGGRNRDGNRHDR